MARSNLFYRALTALILIPIILILIFYSSESVLFFLLAVVIVLCNYELFNLLKIRKLQDQIFGFSLNLIALYLIVYKENLFLNFLVILLLIIIFYSLFVIGIKDFLSYASYYLFSVIYITYLLSFIYKLFVLPNGRHWLLFLLFTNWATDTCAYFIGVKLGRHKFSKISPNKSIEGLLGGIFGGILVALCFNYFSFKINEWFLFVLLGASGSIVGQLSDLIESGIKRSVGVKDSGNMIPGHGGVLDRLDSMFFTAPLFYFFGKFIIEKL